LGETLVASLCPAILDGDGSILDPTEFAQPLHKSVGRRPLKRRVNCSLEPDGWQLRRLLRARRERPRRRCTANERDELASFHSITSSARASSVGGTSSRSALALLRLMTSSYFVGVCTGRSAGFSPLRIRSTYPATSRYWSTRPGPEEIKPPMATK